MFAEDVACDTLQHRQLPGFICFCNSLVVDVFNENTVGEGGAEAKLAIGKLRKDGNLVSLCIARGWGESNHIVSQALKSRDASGGC